MSQLHRNLSGAEIKVSSVSTSEKYKPQHPMLGLPNAIPTSSQDHLDDFTEANPFEREEMEDAEISLGIGKALNRAKGKLKGKLAKRAAKKAAKKSAAQAEKLAEKVNKLASGLNKLNKAVKKASQKLEIKKSQLREKVNQLISASATKHKIEEDTLRSDMEKFLNTLGQELLN